jgi:hypothetical protein
LPLTWWKTRFGTPAGLDTAAASDDAAAATHSSDVQYYSLLLDALGMSRGHYYINGVDMGRYWLINGPSHRPTQRYYHIPTPYLCTAPGCTNTLVLADEFGGAGPTQVRLVKSTMQTKSTMQAAHPTHNGA